MPKVVCRCGATFPLSKEEAISLNGAEFRCPECRGIQPTAAPSHTGRQGTFASSGTAVRPRHAELLNSAVESGPEPVQSAIPPVLLAERRPMAVERLRRSPYRALLIVMPAVSIGIGLLVGWALFGHGHRDDIAPRDRDVVAVAPEKQAPPEEIEAHDVANPAVVETQHDAVRESPGEERPSQPVSNTDEKPVQRSPHHELVDKVQPAVVMVINPDRRTLGSGFFVDNAGTLITNFHVIGGATEAKVVFHDKTTAKVTGFIAVSAERDIAILRIERPTTDVPFLTLANDVPHILDPVWAFGAPHGLSDTVTPGSVNAIRSGDDLRRILMGAGKGDIYSRDLGYTPEATWIQMSAPISGGNSGGPLVNEQSEVVGMATWQDPTGQNLNFAISVEHVKQMLAAATPVVRPLAALPPFRNSGRVAANADANGPSPRPPPDATIRSRLEPRSAKRHADASKPADKTKPRVSPAAALRLARLLIEDGRTDPARARLETIVKEYPGSAAAKEARLILDRLGKR